MSITAQNKKICQQKRLFCELSIFQKFHDFYMAPKRTYQQDLSFYCVTKDSTSKEKYSYLIKVFLYKLHQKANKAFCWIATENSMTEIVSARNFVV